MDDNMIDTRSAYDRAMETLRDQMATSQDGMLVPLGEMLCTYLAQSPEIADAILGAGDKGLQEAFDKMRDAAKKKQKHGCYYMAPSEALGIACTHYGIPPIGADELQTENRPTSQTSEKAQTSAHTPDTAPAAKSLSFDDIMSLLD